MADLKNVGTATTDISHLEDTPHYLGDMEKRGLQGDQETARYAAQPIEIDAATNKRLFWMVNRRILAVMLVTYFCQSLDKGTLNFASIMGIKKDANLHGQQVSPSPRYIKSKILSVTDVL